MKINSFLFVILRIIFINEILNLYLCLFIVFGNFKIVFIDNVSI